MKTATRDTAKTDAAAACFREGVNCARAVLSGFGLSLGMDRTTAVRVAGTFGAIRGVR